MKLGEGLNNRVYYMGIEPNEASLHDARITELA